MLPSMGAMSDQATLKNLLNQLLLSGMSIPQENQSIDYRRLQEELLRSSNDMRGLDRMNSGFSYRDSRDMNNQYDREKYSLTQQRDHRDERIDALGQDRSNFFGGALERKDTRDFIESGTELSWEQKSKWQPSGDFDSEWDGRRQEMMRDGNRKTTQDDISRDIRGTSFFNTSLSSTPNILSSLQLPSTLPSLGSNQQVLHNSVGSDMWSAPKDQASMGYMYGMENNFSAAETTAQVRPIIQAFEPPPPNVLKPTSSEKPEGCHTIFIGGLPERVTEDIIREIFCMCGEIQTIRISTGKSGKNFCHVRFMDPQSVDMALGYSGYRLAIANGSQTSAGRIHVDYAKSREDEKDYEKLLRAKAREVRHQSEMEEQVIIFTERAAAELMKSIRSDSGFLEAFQMLAQWLERGECSRKNSSTFYNLLSSVHSHVRRLVKEKREHEEIVERQKKEQIERVKLMMSQGASILKVFDAASKKKCWDHFSKAQRRNVGDWHQQVEKAIKISAEEQMENRVEVGMDIDDEVYHIQSTSESSQREDENSGEPEAKQPKLEESSDSKKTQTSVETKSQTALDATTQAALQAKDMKYRAQAAGLKALAGKNTSLMWQVEGYKNEILMLKQRFASVFQDKDLQIARLMTAVQALQNFLQHVTLNTNETKAKNIEVEVTKGTSDVPTENTEQETTEEAVTESNGCDNTEMVDETQGEEGKNTEKESEEEDNASESNDAEVTTAIDTGLTSNMEKKSSVDIGTEDAETEKDKQAGDCVVGADKDVAVEDNTASNDGESEDVCDENRRDEHDDTTPVVEETAKTTNANSTSDGSSADVVRLSANQMVVVGLLCSYLQICTYGATTDQVLTHIRRQVPGVTSEELENILNSLPMLFSGDGLEFMNKTWKFNVLNM